ncbi:hypothetical protein [Pseudomonas aeruginosa]|uniref:hypothetical protein n=1 Tax=Pseudomonas aeruginosa TaxID=287 RepID=UPI000FF47EC7|nr:hypothetical protein [Pseudomonas aeruginosa]RPO36063.1 hypothetical protein IPC1225_29100 [Pseudomonas aeruginosa]
MVTNVTNFSRSGLYDWMAQRVSAVVLAAYVIFLLGYLTATVVRFLFQAVCGMAMFAFFVWGVQILWGM